MRLRLAEPGDGAAIAEIYAPIVAATAISFEETPPDTATMTGRIIQQAGDKPWLVAERDGMLLGYAYASTFRARPAYRFGVEVTVYVAEAARRSGVARTLYAALFALLAAQGYRRAFAGVTQPNDASDALHRAAGFAEIGTFPAAGWKFGRWHDVRFYARTLRALDVPEHDPLALHALDPAILAEALHCGDR
jgi:phosphinothricin acetyltransferase